MDKNVVLRITLWVTVLVGAVYSQNITGRTDAVLLGKTSGANVIGVKYPNYDAFYGIPFAEAPVGKLRFANPVNKTLPKGDFLADKVPPMCTQPDLTDPTGQRIQGAEDCLYLNIYRPNTNQSKTNYDVLFYLHGGGYLTGSSNPAIAGPTYLMNNGSVILVAPQYRLNTMGFLATGDQASPGNYALKDQALALKWVKDNIKAFGGNPDSITIAGQSAGASSVHMLMMSPLSKDLIKGAIALSGVALGPWNYPTQDPLALTRQHAQVLNVTNADKMNSTQLVGKLREMPAEDLIRSVMQMKLFGIDPITLYRPVVEPNGTTDAFLTESPYDNLKRGGIAQVPFMNGVVQNEGSIRSLLLLNNQTQREYFNKNLDTAIPLLMELRLNGTDAQNFTKQIQNRYNLTKGIVDKDSEQGIQQLYTDRSFYYPAYRTLQLHQNKSKAPVYFHSFNYRGQNSTTDLQAQPNGRGDFGVVHTDDLIYLFDFSALLGPLSDKDQLASDRFVQHVVQFVQTQTPPGTVQCTKMAPMCSYVNFYKNSTGYLDTEIRNDFNTDMVKFFDQTNEIPL